jgi:hypothetical protein
MKLRNDTMKTADIEYAAHEAVFGLQLSVEKAIAFVQRAEQVDRKTATQAVDQCMQGSIVC